MQLESRFGLASVAPTVVRRIGTVLHLSVDQFEFPVNGRLGGGHIVAHVTTEGTDNCRQAVEGGNIQMTIW